MRTVLTSLLIILTINSLQAQSDTIQTESSDKCSLLTRQVVPLSLVSAGALLNIGDVRFKIQNSFPDTDISLDEYLQYVPVGQLYLYDLSGVRHQNNWFDQTKYLIISQLAAGAIDYALKISFDTQRPNGENESFPSGHTTRAFVGATVLYHEFRDSDPMLAWSGFIVAATTGVLRMTNDAHFLPDVLAGAGIGILTVNVVYYLKPFKKISINPGKKDMTIVPALGYKSFAVSCNF